MDKSFLIRPLDSGIGARSIQHRFKIGCPDRHALPVTPSPPPPKMHRPRRPSSRESGFVLGWKADHPRLRTRWRLCADSGRSRGRDGTDRFDPKPTFNGSAMVWPQHHPLHLPRYSPELNGIERVWVYLRERLLSGFVQSAELFF
jgi:hypothetical protein